MKCPLIFFLLILAAPLFAREECTVAVISGKATSDGRPLLWKNRDSSNPDNEIAFFSGAKYDFIGVINQNDTSQVWMGVNVAGFAIMNSESMDQSGNLADSEGVFMKTALANCGRVQDFEKLLKSSNGKNRGTQSNFGCIDGYGGAAFFETSNDSFCRFDADDSTLAPNGVLVRANFSMTGSGGEAYGVWRFQRAKDLLAGLARSHRLNYATLLQKVARDIASDAINPYPLPCSRKVESMPAGCVPVHNSINRNRTVCCGVFLGVLPGENPASTTFWCMLGNPICSVSVPLWPGVIPSIDLNGKAGSYLNRRFRQKQKQLYIKKYPNYLDTKQLFSGRTPFFNRIIELENSIFNETAFFYQEIRRRPLSWPNIATFQEKMIHNVILAY
jgi:hypothetical protein